MFVLVDLIGFSVPVASPLLTVLLFGMNFLGNRWALRASATPDRLARRSSAVPPESGAG
jgi:hypothetical protein